MAALPGKLRSKLNERQTEDALRKLCDYQDMIDFTSNDYLGFANDQELYQDTLNLLHQRGIYRNGSTGSRLLSGHTKLFEESEAIIARFHQSQAALIFNSGYDANLGFLSAVPQRDDLILYDELVHASIRDGIGMSKARHYKFRHNNLEDLETIIKRNNKRISPNSTVYVITESVFSMDGDSPDLVRLVEICQRENCLLFVDEAHAVGVFGERGRGLLNELELQDEVFARIVTFGKALGIHGAAILGSNGLKDYLVNFARSFIYTTALAPHSIAGIYTAYMKLDSEQGENAKSKLAKRITFFKAQIQKYSLTSHFIPSDSAIQSCLVPGNSNVKKIARQLNEKSFDVRPILSPTVERGSERLRFCLHSFNTEEEIEAVLNLLAKSSIIK